ncbi:MAG: hypothetical protein WB810_08905 [Candidatus Cybelea sp.]
MSVFEQLMAAAAIGQIVVIALGAFFAYQQINRLRRQQEADLVQRIFATLNEPQFAKALDFVYRGLAMRLTETAYVLEIAEGKATAASHPEFIVLHFFNGLGLLVHARMVGEYPIVQIVASPCIRAWERLSPVVELLRRRFPHAYTPFESLVARSHAIDLVAVNARFRAETPQLREQWEATARELAEKRIALLDDHEPG